jgi:hypothetical protein
LLVTGFAQRHKFLPIETGSMSDKVRYLYYGLWIMHPLLQTGIAAFMLRRGLLKQFKFFFAYILTQIVGFAILFPAFVWRSYDALFYLYWASNAVSVTCGFLVIHEVFVDMFKFFHTLRDLGSVLFKWAGLVMLLVAAVVSVSANSPHMSPWIQAIITSQRCVRIIQVGMVMFLLFFAQYVGVSRKQHSFGIALGFGTFAIIELILICSWVGNHLGDPWMSIINMTAYNVSLTVWISYVAVKRPARDVSRSLLQPQRWEQSLTDIHHPLPADSLIPMFEGMVDRALSRTSPPLNQMPLAERAAAGTGAGGTGSFTVGRSVPKQ